MKTFSNVETLKKIQIYVKVKRDEQVPVDNISSAFHQQEIAEKTFFVKQ